MYNSHDAEIYAAGLIDAVGPENVRLNEPMRNHTSFKVGGPADIFVTPADMEAVCRVISFCRAQGLPHFVMGNGSNLLVRDGGIRGAVINLSEKFNRFRISEEIIETESGALVVHVAKSALENCLGGMEFASGIPGTIGGAVVMNAGAYDREMKDIVTKTVYLAKNGEICLIEGAEHGFCYRNSIFQNNGGIVLKTFMRLIPGKACDIKSKMDDFWRRRREKQPLEYPSAGSVFRRPDGHFAGRLIEECGLKGLAFGGAQISEKHSNFIINTGNASTADVIKLIDYAIESVYNDFGIRLETEIKITGAEAVE